MKLEKLGLKIERVVRGLIQKTNEDKVKWIKVTPIDSDRICGWDVKRPDDKNGCDFGRIELERMAMFGFLNLKLERETVSRDQKLLRGLVRAIRAQEMRLDLEPRLQNVAAVAKKLEE